MNNNINIIIGFHHLGTPGGRPLERTPPLYLQGLCICEVIQSKQVKKVSSGE